MKDIEFGGCLFKYSAKDACLFLRSRDIHGVDRVHTFNLPGSFLVNISGKVWRFVTGIGDGSEVRHLFEDTGPAVDDRVNALCELGVPILNKDEGRQNLERYKLPVKRLLLST